MSRSLDTIINNLRTKSKNPNLDADIAVVYLNGAKQEMKENYRIPSAKRVETLRIFKDINEYALPIPSGCTESDVDNIIDLVEFFDGFDSKSRFDRVGVSDFARKKVRGWHDDYITPYVRNLQNMLLVDYDPGTQNANLNSCDDLTTNGSWSVAGDATNLEADDITYVEGAGSLNFDLSVSSLTATLVNSTISAVDLTDYENNSHLFCYVYLPSITNITAISLKWGSSASAYWTKSITTQFNGLAFSVGWNLLGFDWNTATKVGSPDITATNYLQFNLTYSASPGTTTGFRLDGISCRQGKDMYLIYDSKYWVKTSAGVIKEEFEGSETTDEFVGNNAESECLEAKTLQGIFQMEIIDDNKAEMMKRKYDIMLRDLKARNPEEFKGRSIQRFTKGIFD